jgi:hydrogenase maturation protease
VTSWRIIGIGSPQGADRLGWMIIDRLREHWTRFPLELTRHVELLSLDRPGPALLDHFMDGKKILLVDAVLASDHLPGTILCFDLAQLAHNTTTISTHDVGIASSLALAKALNILPQGILLGAVLAGASQVIDAGVIEQLLDAITRQLHHS